MKKYYLLFVALCGILFLSCKEDPEPEESVPTISLTAPVADGTIDLSTENIVTFTWSVEGNIAGGYTLSLSRSADLTAPETYTSSSTSLEISVVDLNVVLNNLGIDKGTTGKIYWSVKPSSENVKANAPQARALNVKRPTIPTIALKTPTNNTSIDLSKTEKITFAWDNVASIPYYALVFSRSENMSDATAIDMSGNPFELSTIDLDVKLALLGIEEGIPTTIYWSVYPCDLTAEFTKQVRSINITRTMPIQDITLNSPEQDATLELKNGDILFDWENVTAISSYTLKLSANEDMSSPQTIETTSKPFFVTTSLITEKLTALGLNSVKASIYWSIVPSDPNVKANCEVRKLTLDRTVKFDRSTWTADDGGIPHVGFMPYGPEALLDGGTGTQWIPDIGQYPATAIIDMQSEKTVTSIYLYDRQELFTADFYLSTSTTFGSEAAVHMEFERLAHQFQTVQLAVPVKARYIKLVINPFTAANYACPAELEVYGFE
jgi:hypothetical protein